MSERVSIKSNALESTQKTATPQPFRTSALRATPSLSDQILLFQCSIGNQAVQRMIKSGNLKAKLKIGQPGDIYEQEADRVADQVMSMPASVIQAKPT